MFTSRIRFSLITLLTLLAFEEVHRWQTKS